MRRQLSVVSIMVRTIIMAMIVIGGARIVQNVTVALRTVEQMCVTGIERVP